MALTLPTDSEERKHIPLFSGCFQYAPAALMGVAMHSEMGNNKHNPGQPLHHARWKSMDHADCILRHLMDISDMMAIFERGHSVGGALLAEAVTEGDAKALLAECNALCWRALMLSQQVHEQYGGAPLAPRARLGEQCESAPDPGDYLNPILDEARSLEPDPLQPTEMQVVTLGCGCVKRCKGHAEAAPPDADYHAKVVPTGTGPKDPSGKPYAQLGPFAMVDPAPVGFDPAD